MDKEIKEPTIIPDHDYYYHYKHDPEKGIFDHYYEVIGLGRNTEERTYAVLYRPVYENDWLYPAVYQSRPYDMFFETIEKDGKMIKRFTKVEDEEVIKQLKEVSERMYKN